MGLFDVNMPILYGEGKQAFYRLQQEIIRSSSDHTIFAWKSTDEDLLHARDLFATDPSDFQRLSNLYPNIKQCSAKFRKERPYYMTNIGLRCQLPLRKDPNSTAGSWVLLDCQIPPLRHNHPPLQIWMGLEHIHDDQYVRNGCFEFKHFNPALPLFDLVIKRSADRSSFTGAKLIQNPYISYPDDKTLVSGGFRLHAKHPPNDSPNPTRADGRINSLDQPKVIGLAYNYADSDTSNGEFFTVVVGFGCGSPWCDIRPFRSSPRLNVRSYSSFYMDEVLAALREYDNDALEVGLLQSDQLERPPTPSSIDEAALQRAVKRRQILDEIVSTEESYLADLRALVYLMSTILASGTSLPNSVRASVQQNVFDLLHLHEAILEKCHRAALKSAARRWADTLSYRRLRSPRRFRKLESVETIHAQCRGRSSLDSCDSAKTRGRDGAEAADISDLVRPFNSLVTSFLSYEEYTANHGLVAHDLQRHLPALWSTYGAGMESLARSIVSLDRHESDSKKGLTVGDLLIKPIQRVCKYPLLFQELLRVTPVADCPSAHAELESLLQQFRTLVEAVNDATNTPEARLHIQRRWLLQSRLQFGTSGLQHEEFRNLGNIMLCGVLHIAYQTKLRVEGTYALCVLYQAHFLIAFPAETPSKFEMVALIKLGDLKLESPMDGKGLQCPSALHTWKVCFSVGGSLYELVVSACSATEEEQWTNGLGGGLVKAESQTGTPDTILTLDLKSVGAIYNHQEPLARRLSIQRAATVGNRASICQVIVRNTNTPEELHDFRPPWTSAINRSQSHLGTNRIVVLAPKRSERVRLEATLGDVWTKDKLPYPGMNASRGGQIIRASAGSLVRKLSFASIHGPFSRRSASLTLTSRKSSEALSGTRRSRDRVPTFSIRRDSFDEKSQQAKLKRGPEDFRELDTMDSVIHRMIGDHNDAPTTDEHESEMKEARTKQPMTEKKFKRIAM
ncbi:hypothetical protein DV735_g4075, partial [Chaetothyriales sp. CBS 134920]